MRLNKNRKQDELEAKYEALVRDVARFMVLLDKYLSDTQNIDEMHERWDLEGKLRKVGKE